MFKASKFARPTAAPPSAPPFTLAQEKKPERQPVVAESGKPDGAANPHGAAVREEGPLYDVYPVALKNGLKPADDQCTVTFKNLSERAIKLRIDGQERPLAKGDSASVQVKRQFVWQMDGGEAKNEQVGMGDYALLIVIRR